MKHYSNEMVRGFLHTEGRRMVNGDGKEVILRGWGAGNWMNPEGYMMAGAPIGFGNGDMMSGKLKMPRRFDRGRAIHQVIRDLCGSSYAAAFWPRWYRNYLGEEDIRCMAEHGYNSIRLPMDAAALLDEEPGIHFNEDTFAMLDDLIDLCEKYRLYVILDLHGTPGHSGMDCDNGIDNIPRMFLEPETFQRMVTLWTEIARRYGDRWIVGGFELLNEPLFPAWTHLESKLAEFYDTVIREIRKFDRNHMFLLSGPLVGTDTGIFTRSFDPECENWCYVYHGYHHQPQESSFLKFLDASRRLNIPAWYGEGRVAVENMPVYYDMLERFHVGYNLFCWKSEGLSGMENGPVTHLFPEGWEQIIGYITEGGPRPGYAESQKLFDGLLECVRFEHCTVKEDMLNGPMRRPGVTLGAAGYDSAGPGVSFSGGWNEGNELDFRLNDRTHLVLREGVKRPGGMGGGRPMMGGGPRPMQDLYLELEAGGFACYSLYDVTADCPVTVTLRGRGRVRFTCGNLSAETALTEGFAEVVPFSVSPCEKATLRIEVSEGAAELVSVKFGA